MKNSNSLTFDKEPIKEITKRVERFLKGVEFTYIESYYLDYDVDENTGMINKDNKVPYYTSNQVESNLISLRKAYNSAFSAC
jgi:hypothetical protein